MKTREPIMNGQNEKEAAERAMNDPEFQRLLPGYREYEKMESAAKKPIVHGTGSYALRRIIKNGFVPQRLVLTGERAYLDIDEQINWVCFTTPENGGEKFSHWYADLTAKNNQLSFDADNYLEPRTIRIVKDVMGGIEAMVDRVSYNELDNIPDEELAIEKERILEETKTEIRKEFEWSVEDRGRKAANVFDPDIANEEITQLMSLLEGIDERVGNIEEIIRKFALLDEFRSYHVQYGDGEKLPLYRNREVIEWVYRILNDKSHDLHALIVDAVNRKIDSLRRKIAEYEALPLEEREEIRDQFPCYIVVEAEGIMNELTQRPKKAKGKFGGIGGEIIELWSHNRIPPEMIREIQVPESRIPLVKSWLEDAGINGIRLVPFEYFEMKEVLEKSK